MTQTTSQTTPHRIVVSGAASGIGAAVARGALARGWQVIGLDLHAQEAAAGAFPIIGCDVSEESSVVAAFTQVTAHWPEGPNAVVHSAGIYAVTPLLDTPAAAWDRVLGINARGSFLVAREGARAMSTRSGDRSVVLLSSVGAVRGDDREPSAAYSASKGAVTSLTRQLAAEFGSAGIRTNAVAPGVIDTAMTTLTDNPEVSDAFFASRVPLRRAGTADEVAAACLFLAGPESAYISGVVLPVDGGQAIL